MRRLIGPDLIRTLTNKDRDIRDTKLVGFVIRCRASGTHTYRVQITRGQWRTIGRVGTLEPHAARAVAETLLAEVKKDTLKRQSEDLSLNHRDAQAAARAAVVTARAQRITWTSYLTNHYAPWLVEHKTSGADTLANLRRNFGEFDDLLLTEFSAFTIERWRVTRLKTGVTPATVNRDLSALRGALSRAREWGLLKRAHPMEFVKAAKEDTIGRLRYLSADEDARLLAALDARDETRRAARLSANVWRAERGYAPLPAYGVYTDHLSPLVRLALHTGCRFGELTALRWTDVDLVAARLTVRGAEAKSGKTRHLPLNATAVDVLKTWRSSSTSAGLIFAGADDDTEIVDIKTAWKQVLTAATITGFRVHDLRHTFASRLVQAGVDLNTVRELLGHADLKMTLRYAHLAPENKASAVAKLVSA